MTKDSNATTLSLRLAPEERRLVEEAAAKKGWKAANFLRVSALERAAQVMNLSRPNSFDFSGAAKRFAEALVAPRTVTLGDLVNSQLYVGWDHLGEMSLADIPNSENFRMDELCLQDFRPTPLTRDEVEKLQAALRLGGAEFAAELIIECYRLMSVANDPNLPPPIDPHNLKDHD